MTGRGVRTAVTLVMLVVLTTVSPAVISADTNPLGPRVSVATWNILKANAIGVPEWSQRRLPIQRTLLESGADVLALTEVTQHDVGGVTQREDLAQLLAPTYVPVTVRTDQCVRPRDEQGRLAGPNPCTHTATLWFNPQRIEQISSSAGGPASGRVMASAIAPGLTPTASSREVTYALLAPSSNPASVFFVVSVHLPTEKTVAAEQDRVLFARSLTGWANQVTAAAGYPQVGMVAAGDLNSYAIRQPNGAQRVLTDAGWVDPFYGPLQYKRGGRFATINITPSTRAQNGFPAKPYTYAPKREATRIDYVLLRGPLVPIGYETIVHLTSDGNFDPVYRGSDHNAVEVEFAIEQ